ncbi:MAG: BatA and WFA domain-containing protein [Phycisphaeraceae bacterium]|nr:BatA and WFA domain-containing protein [Phycisphaeraceae bacterium]
MTFLAPMTGIIAGAIALPVLITFYLLKLHRRAVRISSTLLWDRVTHDLQVNAPLRWLRPSWLLLLQILALLAFVGALARPAMTGATRASRVVIVMDHSASMSATDGRNPSTGEADGSTRLSEARARALDLVSRLGRSGGSEASEAMVVEFAAQARSVTGFTSGLSTIREGISRVQPTDQPAAAEALQRLVHAMAREPDEEETADRTSVYIFSDGGFLTEPGAAAPGGPGMDVRLVRSGPPPPPPLPPPAATPAPTASNPAPWGFDNLGIVALSTRRDADNPSLIRIFARLQNASDRPIDTTLQARLDGEIVGTRELTVPPATRHSASSFEGGESGVSFDVTHAGGGTLVVTQLRKDLLAADDTAGVVLSRALRPAVLLVAPRSRGSNGRTGPDPFLVSVLQEMDLRRLLVVDEAAYAANPIRGRADEEAFDLVVFDRVRPAALPPIPSLSFGATVPIPGVGVAAPDDEDQGASRSTRVLSWRRTHPVLRYVGLDPIVIAPPMVLTLPGEAGDPAAPQVTTESLAQGAFGPLIALVEQPGVRRIIVGFDLARSNWGPDVSFPVFMANAVEFLTLRGEAAAGRSYTTAEPVSVTPESGATELAVAGPLTERVPVSAAAPGEISLGVLPRVGIYQIAGAAPADSTIAVNLMDPVSSLLRTEDISADGIVGASSSGPSGETPDEGPREIWPWFVLAGLVLSAAEWFLYAWRMHT